MICNPPMVSDNYFGKIHYLSLGVSWTQADDFDVSLQNERFSRLIIPSGNLT